MAKARGRPKEIEEGKRLSVVLSKKQIEQVRLGAVELTKERKRPIGVSEAMRIAIEKYYPIPEQMDMFGSTIKKK